MTTSNVFFETALPSGRCVRFAPLKTRQKLMIDRKVEAEKGDSMSVQIATIATCLKAYTAPQPIVFKKDKDGAPTSEVDLDAMLDAVPEGAWVKPTYLDLITDGDGHCLELFEALPDWVALTGAISMHSGYGDVPAGLLAGKARMGSSAR